MIHIGWLAPQGCWDQNLICQLLNNHLYPTGLEFTHHKDTPQTDGCVVVIPGKFWCDDTDQLCDMIANYRWVLAIRVSDEEDWLDIKAVEHHNMLWWTQYARVDRDYSSARMLGVGHPPHFNELSPTWCEKTTDVFLSAQNTHARRNQAFEHLNNTQVSGIVHETKGFTQGLPPDTYAECMRRAKIAPAPSGAATPDSFRVYEALQAHCVPIADDVCPLSTYDSRGYWRRLFPDAPFTVFEDYNDLPELIDNELHDWPRNANRITAWWMRYKRSLTHALRDDLTALHAL